MSLRLSCLLQCSLLQALISLRISKQLFSKRSKTLQTTVQLENRKHVTCQSTSWEHSVFNIAVHPILFWFLNPILNGALSRNLSTANMRPAKQHHEKHSVFNIAVHPSLLVSQSCPQRSFVQKSFRSARPMAKAHPVPSKLFPNPLIIQAAPVGVESFVGKSKRVVYGTEPLHLKHGRTSTSAFYLGWS